MVRLIKCIAVLCALLFVSLGLAQAATKEAAAESNVFIMRAAPCPTTPPTPNPPGCGAPNWVDLLSTTIKPAGGKDLLITFSSAVALMTMGANTAAGTPTTTFSAETSNLMVRVLLDGVPVPVGSQNSITFDSLFRSTSATLAGILSSVGVTCTPEVDSGALAGVVSCTTTVHDSTTPSVLDTLVGETSAHAFTWIARDVGVGTHTITVQGQFNVSFAPPTADNSASAIVGARTLTIDQTQLDGN